MAKQRGRIILLQRYSRGTTAAVLLKRRSNR